MTMPIHIVTIAADAASRRKRLNGFANSIFLARIIDTKGIIIRMNAVDSIHRNPNSTAKSGKSWRVTVLNQNCRNANGSTIIKPVIAAILTFATGLFIASPNIINLMGSIQREPQLCGSEIAVGFQILQLSIVES